MKLITHFSKVAIAFSSIFLGIIGEAQSQVVINELQAPNIIELKNIGSTPQDISGYWLCDRPSYIQLNNSSLTIDGDLDLSPGEIVTVTGFNVVDGAGGEMGLFNSSSFGSSTAILDYVIWGTPSASNRESVAVDAGIWTSGELASTFSSSQSLQYFGSDDLASNYSALNPTIGQDNCNPEAGVVSLDEMATTNANGTTAVDGNSAIICIDSDAAPVSVTKTGQNTSLSYRYVITDDQNTILNIVNTNSIDLTGAGEGTCRIWGWSYRGTPNNGLDFVGEPLADLEAVNCSDISENWVTVIRVAPEAGTVSLDADATTQANPSTAVDGNTAIICIDSDAAPVAVTKTGHETNLSYRYVITDDQNTILNIVNTNSIDLTGAGEGTCRIWGWSYRGTPNNGLDFVGEPLADLEAVNCSDISENWVTVIRVAPEAGTVSLDADATTQANPSTAVDGNTAIICIDSDAAPVAVTKTGHETNLSYRYVITDDQNTILNIVNTNSIDLTGAGEGTCRIWGWSYRGTPNNGLDFVGEPLTDLDAVNCSDISENWVTVIRVAPEAGTVSLDADTTTQANPSTAVDGNTAIICIDSDAAPVAVTKTGHETNLSYRYVITDDQNTILNIVNTNSIDLTGAGEGTCRIWGWSYRGTPNNGLDFVGEPLADLEAVNCSDISENWVTVIRVAPEAGTVSIDATATGNPNGTTTIDGNTATILVDGQPDPIVINRTGEESNLSYRYVITDETDTILNIVNTNSISLDGAGPGICRIWGWSYRGTPDNGAGFIDGPLADLEAVNCSDISDNFITVNRLETLEAKIVINETDGDNIVQLKNIGTASLDISGYWLCNFPTYTQLSNLSIDGDLDLAPGETVDILNFTAINKDDSELGLYSTNSFGSTDAIVDYIEWGSTGHQRSSVAVSAGTWTAGDFISSIPENDFIVYDGEGDAAADYTLNSTLSTEDFISNSVTVTLFPNPVLETLNISNTNYTNGDRVSLYDLSGKIVLSQSLEEENSTIDVNALSTGVYILEYSTTSGDSTTRKIVKQ